MLTRERTLNVNSIADFAIIAALGRHLNRAVARQQVAASNPPNIDTPVEATSPASRSRRHADDPFGRSLTLKGLHDEEAASGPNLDTQRRLERELTTRVVAMLEPIVGGGRVRVNVAARLSDDSAEETEARRDRTTVPRDCGTRRRVPADLERATATVLAGAISCESCDAGPGLS